MDDIGRRLGLVASDIRSLRVEEEGTGLNKKTTVIMTMDFVFAVLKSNCVCRR